MSSCRKLLILSLIILAAGCSALKLSYNKAPELVYWWLDGYLDFTDAQQPEIRSELAKLHAWHHSHELPGYIRLLDKMKSMNAANVEARQVCEIVEQVRQHGRNLNRQAASITQQLAPTFTAEQLDHLQKKFDKRNEDWREDWLDGSQEDRASYRFKEAVKRWENIYGSMEQPQEELLRQYIATASFDPKTSYAEIVRRQQKALHILRAIERHQLSDADAAREISKFYDQLIDPADKHYQRYLQSMTQESCQLIAALHNSANAKQRHKAAEKLQLYIDDLSHVKKPVSP